MDDAFPALFRPTWRQALGHGLYLAALASVVALTVILFFAPRWAWPLVVATPPLLGVAAAVRARHGSGTEISARGIRTATHSVEPWSEVVDLRAERRGGRTVVSVYLESGASVQLAAPYSGEFFAADPRFESKVFTLSHLWRSHRVGGLPC